MSLVLTKKHSQVVAILKNEADDDDYKYYIKICDYLHIKSFEYSFFYYHKKELIGTHRYRWMFDINPIYGEWHTSYYNKINGESGYKYSKYTPEINIELDSDLAEGLQLLQFNNISDYIRLISLSKSYIIFFWILC